MPADAVPPVAERWTTIGLLDHFMHVHHEMPDRAFAFVLGAGASKSSGIPTGAELVHQWLSELHRQLDPDRGTRSLHDWATAEHLRIPGFEFQRAAEFYSQVFPAPFQKRRRTRLRGLGARDEGGRARRGILGPCRASALSPLRELAPERSEVAPVSEVRGRGRRNQSRRGRMHFGDRMAEMCRRGLPRKRALEDFASRAPSALSIHPRLGSFNRE